ncbi:MAG: hypothetical protein V4820_21840 [Pseudomonadota bacterium]|uniref:hypothetical protein n=1 Tax=Phenylobacterium sp. TaxID=1871053 RepID=UPI002728BB43|nr:hypothetical protein [Phenylobacterium sp.]MDO9429787.1 hypothetical protein [Phenylobacterium sp.]
MSARDRSVTEPASFASQDDLDPAVVDLDGVEELEAESSRQGIGRRADRAPADREHGLKTRARNKEINSGRPFAG